jgi:hypothetical protein
MQTISTKLMTKEGRPAFALASLVGSAAEKFNKNLVAKSFCGNEAFKPAFDGSCESTSAPEMYLAVRISNNGSLPQQSFHRAYWDHSRKRIRGGDPGRKG